MPLDGSKIKKSDSKISPSKHLKLNYNQLFNTKVFYCYLGKKVTYDIFTLKNDRRPFFVLTN